MTESDIMHENGNFWVLRDKSGYLVLRSGITHRKRLRNGSLVFFMGNS